MHGCDMGLAGPLMMASMLAGTVLVAILLMAAFVLVVRALRRDLK